MSKLKHHIEAQAIIVRRSKQKIYNSEHPEFKFRIAESTVLNLLGISGNHRQSIAKKLIKDPNFGQSFNVDQLNQFNFKKINHLSKFLNTEMDKRMTLKQAGNYISHVLTKKYSDFNPPDHKMMNKIFKKVAEKEGINYNYVNPKTNRVLTENELTKSYREIPRVIYLSLKDFDKLCNHCLKNAKTLFRYQFERAEKNKK